MLTWALVTLHLKLSKDYEPNGLHLVIAMGCDVAIVYYISEAFQHACK